VKARKKKGEGPCGLPLDDKAYERRIFAVGKERKKTGMRGKGKTITNNEKEKRALLCPIVTELRKKGEREEERSLLFLSRGGTGRSVQATGVD